jgi:hypothetical protein
MKEIIDGVIIIFGTLLAIVGAAAFVEGVARPWLLAYVARCEEERRKSGDRRPLDRGDDGTA